jgi:hypothetical protein
VQGDTLTYGPDENVRQEKVYRCFLMWKPLASRGQCVGNVLRHTPRSRDFQHNMNQACAPAPPGRFLMLLALRIFFLFNVLLSAVYLHDVGCVTTHLTPEGCTSYLPPSLSTQSHSVVRVRRYSMRAVSSAFNIDVMRVLRQGWCIQGEAARFDEVAVYC